jgi:hypothetical protein
MRGKCSIRQSSEGYLLYEHFFMNRFRARLPKLSELYDRFVTDDPRNFFREFPARLRDVDSATFAFYKEIDVWLSYIPKLEWVYYANKIKQTVPLCDLSRHRFWEQLHDVFNEALGVLVLRRDFGCDEVHFVRPDGAPVPDLAGQRGQLIHYLEVKTINHSQDERDSWYEEDKLKHTTLLPKALEQKIQSSYGIAMSQLSAPDDARTAKKIALLVFNADHNFDPIDKSVAEAVREHLSSIENPSFEIICRIYAPSN